MKRSPIVLAGLLVSGCARPSLSSFVPELTLGLRVVREHAAITSQLGGGHELTARAFVTLAFRPRTEASVLPARGDASGLALATPCADDDPACFEELAAAERELSPLAEDVP